MTANSLLWNALVWGAAATAALLYYRGWRRLLAVQPGVASRFRAASAFTSLVIAASALAWPLDLLSETSLLARMAQTVALCLIVAPLLWLSVPFHLTLIGLPRRTRKQIVRMVVTPSRLQPLLQAITAPLVVWFLYLSAVLTWHDPGFVNLTMARPALHRASALLLFCAALLFWQQITACGPRRYSRANLATRLAMLVGIEVANVIAGITIAFGNEPLYLFYASQGNIAQVVMQQNLAGAMTWVFGSVVYILSAVLVVNQTFKQEGIDRPQRPADWDADERFIAPGLEGRLGDPSRLSHDWRDY